MSQQDAQSEPTSSFWINARRYLHQEAAEMVPSPLRGRVDPSDLVQIALLRANRSLHQYRGQSDRELLAWMRRILENTAGEQWRFHLRERRHVDRETPLQEGESTSPPEVLASPCTTSSPGLSLIEREDAARLCVCIDELPDDQRTAVILRHLHQKTISEMARLMQRTECSIGGLLRRGMQNLRSQMSVEGVR